MPNGWLLVVAASCAACLSAPAESDSVDGGVTSADATASDGASTSQGQWSFESNAAPFSTGGSTALASNGQTLWLFRRDGGLLFTTSGWDEPWIGLAAASTLPNSAEEQLYGGALAYAPEPPRLIAGRWMNNESGNGELIAYDIADGQWSFLTEQGSFLNVGFAQVDGQLFGIHHAGEPGLRRIGLDGSGELGSFVQGVDGPDPQWLSRAAKLAYGDGTMYLVKNDWYSPQPALAGDRLASFDPNSFASITIATSVFTTPVSDLGPLPFEIGDGSALILVPAGFGGVGPQGGLVLIAGLSPSNEDGHGDRSDSFALYDIARAEWTGQSTLPAPVGTGTSAIFYNGAVIICAATENETVLWRLSWIEPG